jgi:hypothetical protein
MELRDAVEADAERLSSLTDTPHDVMRNLVHDRTVRVAEREGEIAGFVSFDAREGTVHVTQLKGEADVYIDLLEEPVRFARSEGMVVELLAPDTESDTREAADAAGFEHAGTGPYFDGESTVRYRLENP